MVQTVGPKAVEAYGSLYGVSNSIVIGFNRCVGWEGEGLTALKGEKNSLRKRSEPGFRSSC